MFYSSSVEKLRTGVNIYGYAFAEHGVGQLMRRYARVARHAGIPYAVIPYVETYSRQQAPFEDFGAGESVFDVNLICVNADTLPRFVECVGEGLLDGRYNIGVWAWELEDFPESMADSARYLDEIWGISRFTADAIARVVSCPVHAVPLTIPEPDSPTRTREELDIGDDFLFLFTFDVGSILDRKNPVAVIEAFERAFSPDEPARLVIKTINGSEFPSAMLRLAEAAVGKPGVQVVDGYLPAGEQGALMSACDAYVSLHRSEGFGFTMAEAMARGKPVIATAYSGNLDFMTEDNSYLVPYDLVEVGGGCEPYEATAMWADPDIDEAARLMRQVFDHPEEARQRADRGRRDILEGHTPAARAPALRERVDAARATHGAAPAGPFDVLAFDPAPTGPAGSERSRLQDTGGEEYRRPHREFDSVAEVLRDRGPIFDWDRVVPRLSCGSLDGVRAEADGTTSLWGWAYDPHNNVPASAVVLLIDGKPFPWEIPTGNERPDLAAVDPGLVTAGWYYAMPKEALAGEEPRVEAFAVLSDGSLGALSHEQTRRRTRVSEDSALEATRRVIDEIAALRTDLVRLRKERHAAQQTLDQLQPNWSRRLKRRLRALHAVDSHPVGRGGGARVSPLPITDGSVDQRGEARGYWADAWCEPMMTVDLENRTPLRSGQISLWFPPDELSDVADVAVQVDSDTVAGWQVPRGELVHLSFPLHLPEPTIFTFGVRVDASQPGSPDDARALGAVIRGLQFSPDPLTQLTS